MLTCRMAFEDRHTARRSSDGDSAMLTSRAAWSLVGTT
jgi:hypothetical protein